MYHYYVIHVIQKEAAMPVPESIRRHKPEGFGALEIRCFDGDKFYVYRVSSVYDEKKGRPRKVTGRSIGKITEADGFIPNAEGMRLIQERKAAAVVTVRNHGAYEVLSTLSPDLEERLKAHFPDVWRNIRAFSLIRLVDKASPRMAQHAYDASTFPGDIPHGENTIRAFVRRLGGMGDRIAAFLRDGVEPGRTLLFDGTTIFTRSTDSLAERGYNPEGSLNTQARMLYVFEEESRKPVFYRILQGSVVDRTAFIETVRESGCRDCTVIADKGFYSKTNLSALMEAGLRFILPLQANTRLLDDDFVSDMDDHKFDSAFAYHGRVIWHRKTGVGDRGNWLYVFRDDERRQQLQTRMVERIEKLCGEGVEGEKPMDILDEKRTGYYAMVSNIDADAREIFLSYKARWDIEQCFDYLKNDVEPMASHARDNDYFRGMMFLNHIALVYYYGLVNAVRNSSLKGSWTPEEVIALAKNIYLVEEDGRKRLSEIPGKTKQVLAEIGVDITLKP